jgi:hypothetical protein
MPADAPKRLSALINACWDGEASRRPSFKDILSKLDDVLIDAVIDDECGANFWRQHFLKPELRASVLWPDFARTLLTVVRGEEQLSPDVNPAEELAYFQPLLAINETQTAKGETLVVTMKRFSTNIKWFGRFFETGAQSILSEVEQLQLHPWFHGDISKADAEARLAARVNGTFLVRLSATTPGCPYTVSMINNQHRRVLHSGVGELFYLKGSTHGYKSLIDLVQNCRELDLQIPCERTTLAWGYNG